MGRAAAPATAAVPLRPREALACQCAGVTHAELEAAVAEDEDATVASLGRALGCGLQCGSCLPAIKEALGEVAWFPAAAAATPITRSRDLAGSERLIYRVDLQLDAGPAYPAVRPGQHVVLRARIGGETVERTYTVVAHERAARRLTVAIRRKPGGRMSPWLLDAGDDAGMRRVDVSVPGGRALGSGGRRPDVFFAGGVGVTPAVAMVNALPAGATMHLHYSVTDADDAAFVPQFAASARAQPRFTYTVRATSAEGKVRRSSIRRRVAAYPGAQFYICGPAGYVEFVRRQLQAARVDPARIHVELFAIAGMQSPARSMRARAYTAGALFAALPLFLLMPGLQDLRPHGHPNVGHEKLECVACHAESAGSTRQTLQAKVKHALGLRATGAVLGTQPVTSATCIQCHANPDDRHAPNRFLEPRFQQARAETGAHQCVSCHREHSAARVTAAHPGYCASCHQDLKVKEDRTSPSHDVLVRQKRWDTCLQCHDYHGNHRWNAPLTLQDAATLQSLQRYLKGGASPYGSTIVKARPGKPS
jgi:ferredoxin-NADP reductase/bacterioferritin-associated ferredoxin